MILFSTNDEDFAYGDFESLLDAMADADALHAGAVYYEADTRPITMADIIGNCESLLELWDERLYDEVGDIFDNPFIGVPAAAKQELADLISGWVGKHVDLSIWEIFVGKSRKCALTDADITAISRRCDDNQRDIKLEGVPDEKR